MKKALSFLLSIVIVFSAFSVGIFSISASADNIPIIYIQGQGAALYVKDEEGNAQKVYPFQQDLKTEILNLVSENKDLLIKTFFSQDWSEFDDKICEMMADVFKDIKLDGDGNPTNGSYCKFSFTEKSLKKEYDKQLGIMTFRYFFDWRLSPYEIMDNLRKYVETVQKATGSEDYAIVARCQGTNVALTYMDTYKDPHLKKVVFYAGANNGCCPIGEVFSGQMVFTADNVERYLYCNDFNLNISVGSLLITDEVLREIVTDLSNMYTIDYACWAVNNAYGQIYEDILPRSMRDSYGSFPGYWTMVNGKYYDEAMKQVFGGYEEENAGLIAKIEMYHENIFLRQEEIIADYQDNGGKFFDVVKYGDQAYPVSAESDTPSDMVCFVSDASFGATTTTYTKQFDDKYMASAKENGTEKYISPDKRIDASTGLYPDTTWYINNMYHKDFADCVNPLLEAMVYRDDFTINSDPEYPQYLFYDSEAKTLSPDSTESVSEIDAWYNATQTLPRKIKPYFSIMFKILCAITKALFLPSRYH